MTQVLGAFLGAAVFAQAQLACYEFNGSTTTVSSAANTVSAEDIDIQPGGFVLTTSAVLGNPIPAILADASSLNKETAAEALAANDYIGFTITPTSALRPNLTSLTVDVQAIYGTNTVADNVTKWSFGLFSSEDGFSSVSEMIGAVQSIYYTSTATDTANQSGYSTLTFDLSYLGTLSSSIEFRLYIWTPPVIGFGSGPRNNRRVTLDNITLNGDTSVYIDSTYSGAEAGTITEPYNSLADISAQNIGPSTTIYLKRGSVFRETFNPASMKGTDSQPVVFDAYGTGSDPVIRGAQHITGWTDSNQDGIWEAPVTGTVSALFINGAKQILARYPNQDTVNDGWLQITSKPTTDPDFPHMLVSTNLKDATYWNGATCVIRAAAWVESMLTVTNWNNSTKTLYFDSNLYADGDKYDIGWGFYLQNVKEELDEDGEWYHDTGASTLYYKKPANVDLSTDTVEASTLDRGIVLNPGDEYIQFKNIQIDDFVKYGIQGLSANNITVDSCTFLNNGWMGVWLSGQDLNAIENIVIKNSTFQNSGIGCISLSYVNGYTIEENLTEDNYRTAILVSVGENGSVKNNTIRNAGYNGIHIHCPVQGNLVESNLVDGFCTEFGDGGAFYTWDNMPMATGNPDDAMTIGWNEFKDNIAINGHTSHPADGNSIHNSCGIYLDDNSSMWTVDGNIVVNPGDTCYLLHNTRDTEAYGNLFYGGNHCNIYLLESDQVGTWWNTNYSTYENMASNNINENISYISINDCPLAVNMNWVTRYEHPDGMIGAMDNNLYGNPFRQEIDIRQFYTNGTIATGGTLCTEVLTLADHQDEEGLNIDNNSMLLVTAYNESMALVNTDRFNSATFTLDTGNYVDLAGDRLSNPVSVSPWSAKVVVRDGTITTQADCIVSYEFTCSTCLTIDTNASSADSNLSAGAIHVTPGGFVPNLAPFAGNPVPGIAADATALNEATAGDALAANDYIGFTVTPNTGFAVNPSHLTVDVQKIYGTTTTTGDNTVWTFGLYSSADGFSSTNNMIGKSQSVTYTSTGAASHSGFSTLTFDLSSLEEQTSAVEFRLYIWTPFVTGPGPRNNRRINLDNVALYGKTAP